MIYKAITWFSVGGSPLLKNLKYNFLFWRPAFKVLVSIAMRTSYGTAVLILLHPRLWKLCVQNSHLHKQFLFLREEENLVLWMKENTILGYISCSAAGIEGSDYSVLLSASHVWNTVPSFGSSRSNSDEPEWVQWRGILHQDGQGLENLHWEEGKSVSDWNLMERTPEGRSGGAKRHLLQSEGIIKDTEVGLALKCSGGKQEKTSHK